MPRTTDRAQVLHEINIAIEDTACACVLASEKEEEEENSQWEDLEDLVAMQDQITSHRYLPLRDTSAGRLDSDVFEAYIYEYPETTS